MNDDAQIMRMLGAHRDVVTGGSPRDHFDVDVLTRHATGQLSAARARAVSEHLLVCDDGRCVAFVRSNAEDVDAAAALLYPVEEAEMHARTFLCREALWQAFEEMAREQGAPIDDVLSDAMRSYARQRSYGAETMNPGYASQGPDSRAHDYDAENAPDLARTSAVRQPTQRLPPANESMRRAPMPVPAPSRPSGVSGMGMPPPPPMSARGGSMQRPFTQPINQPLPAPPQRGRPMAAGPPAPVRSRSVPPPPRSVPPPLPPSDPMMPTGSPMYGSPQRSRGAMMLTLAYNGRHVDVNKERFILGRSKTQADLVLEDPNVSRQHAAIERVGNDWFLADLGSTNGCYIDGQRVSRRQIADGDVIEITTHQVQCSLR
jgi:FHA domain